MIQGKLPNIHDYIKKKIFFTLTIIKENNNKIIKLL